MSFSDVEEVLKALKKRVDLQGKTVDAFYSCSWRNKLQSVFGMHL